MRSSTSSSARARAAEASGEASDVHERTRRGSWICTWGAVEPQAVEEARDGRIESVGACVATGGPGGMQRVLAQPTVGVRVQKARQEQLERVHRLRRGKARVVAPLAQRRGEAELLGQIDDELARGADMRAAAARGARRGA